MKVVLDTNIHLSGLVFPKSYPSTILSLARKDKFETFCSRFIIDELQKNLIGKFDYSPELAQLVIGEILIFTTIIHPNIKVTVIKERDADNRILECAYTADADYLVSGDKKHILPLKKIGKCKIIPARDFINLIS